MDTDCSKLMTEADKVIDLMEKIPVEDRSGSLVMYCADIRLTAKCVREALLHLQYGINALREAKTLREPLANIMHSLDEIISDDPAILRNVK